MERDEILVYDKLAGTFCKSKLESTVRPTCPINEKE